MTQLEQLRYVDARCSGLPKKSRVPEFLKYLGLQCPKYKVLSQQNGRSHTR
jgi:hypothetical protein